MQGAVIPHILMTIRQAAQALELKRRHKVKIALNIPHLKLIQTTHCQRFRVIVRTSGLVLVAGCRLMHWTYAAYTSHGCNRQHATRKTRSTFSIADAGQRLIGRRPRADTTLP
jgi:hypothetical protein